MYFGDLDPSVENMDLIMQKKIDNVLGSRHEINIKFNDIKFQRILGNQYQIEKYDLPKDPDSETLEKLDKDSITDEFKKKT